MFLFTTAEGGEIVVFLTYFSGWINLVATNCGKFTINFCYLPYSSLVFLICWCCDLENSGSGTLPTCLFLLNTLPLREGASWLV